MLQTDFTTCRAAVTAKNSKYGPPNVLTLYTTTIVTNTHDRSNDKLEKCGFETLKGE